MGPHEAAVPRLVFRHLEAGPEIVSLSANYQQIARAAGAELILQMERSIRKRSIPGRLQRVTGGPAPIPTQQEWISREWLVDDLLAVSAEPGFTVFTCHPDSSDPGFRRYQGH